MYFHLVIKNIFMHCERYIKFFALCEEIYLLRKYKILGFWIILLILFYLFEMNISWESLGGVGSCLAREFYSPS